MARFRPAVMACAVMACAPAVALAELPPSPAVATAVAQARDLLRADRTTDAVAVLERHLTNANGNREFLDALRDAYTAEVRSLQRTNADPRRLADTQTKLALLAPAAATEPPPPITPPAPPPSAGVPFPAPPKPAAPQVQVDDAAADKLRQATAAFNEAKAELADRPKAEPRQFKLAAALFAAAFLGKVEMTPEQQTTWAYCRIRIAADTLNRSGGDPAAAAEVAAEVEDALKLAPTNAGLQKVGNDLIAAARQRAGNRANPIANAAPAGTPVGRPADRAADGWDVIETGSFRVKFTGDRAAAEAIARAAEAKREAIFARWSGPPSGAWAPKCDVTIHPTADAFARSTRQPAAATGRAVVQLSNGEPVERRIDLRADDDTATQDALPRELTTVVLADLFRDRAPPKWVEVGMAVLAASPLEVDRYRRTLDRCAQSGELMSVAALLDATAPPADRVTGFTVESVSLVEFLVRWKGEKAFTTFVRDSQRYGQASALKRQYGVADARRLEDAWRQSELTASRGQAPR